MAVQVVAGAERVVEAEQLTPSAALLPKKTLVTPVTVEKLMPLTVTVVPAGPWFGEIVPSIGLLGSPVAGSRKTGEASWEREALKLNNPSTEPAMFANDPGIWPRPQFCSIKAMIDDWSVNAWLT